MPEAISQHSTPGHRSAVRTKAAPTITAAAGDKAGLRAGLVFRRVKPRELLAVTEQMALMLDTGTTVVEALEALAEQTSNEDLAETLRHVARDVSGGFPLATALEAHPSVFNNVYVASVRAGEASGTLNKVFARLQDHLRKREEFASSIRTALVYPVILTILATGAIIFLVGFVLPKFRLVFANSGVPLPLPTRMLLGGADLVRLYWYAPLILVCALGTGAYLFIASPRGKLALDKFLLRLPFVGSLITTIQTSALLRIMGELLNSGVPLVEAMDVAGRACGNTLFSDLVRRISNGVLQGQSFAHSFCLSSLIPAPIKQMITTGERTGKLGPVMSRIAGFQEDAAENQLKRFSVIFEPMIIIVMGIIIGFIAVAILLPLFKLTAAVRAGAGM
jgi:type IV pilus assembly protein PilC